MSKIVIIDSGVNRNHPKLEGAKIEGIHLWKDAEGNVRVDDDVTDGYGHGTAVTNIVNRNSQNNEICMIKIFQGDYQTDEDLLTASLHYIYDHIPCDVINLSLGVTEYESLAGLKEICERLYQRGTVLVSAFDNFGMVSFPAAFEHVIGVDTSVKAKKNKEYEVVKNSYVNVLGKGGVQRVAWTEPAFIITKGNSFVAPYITCVVADAMNEGVRAEEMLQYLEENAIGIVDYCKAFEEYKPEKFMPQKAMVFPFNKEMHSIVRFADRLSFTFDVCDMRESGLVGSNTSIKVPGSDYLIGNVMNLDWTEDFDTFILGHNEELSILTKKDIAGYILEKCVEYHKNVFAFDDLSKYPEWLARLKQAGCKVYYPQVDMGDVPRNSFDKLYFIPKPVLMVCGTSSAQGKFTLQSKLRDCFERRNLKVAQIGTEPSSILYGYDEVCPIGYGANVRISDYRFVSAVNKMFFEVAQKDCDVIISGTQSGTIAYNYDTLRNIPLYSMEYMMGAKPDGVVLCVNPFDEVSYLKRTIATIENLYETKIVALSLFPLTYENNWAGNSGLKRKITETEKRDFIKNAHKEFDIPVFAMDEEEQYEKLFECVLDYFLQAGEEECHEYVSRAV